jgi:hypothetical protein
MMLDSGMLNVTRHVTCVMTCVTLDAREHEDASGVHLVQVGGGDRRRQALLLSHLETCNG